MTRSEILEISKPILFNSEMVRAILDGRKTETRRAVKDAPNDTYRARCVDIYGDGTIWAWDFFYGSTLSASRYITIKQPYQVRDYLYVRETWSPLYPDDKSNDVAGYMYRADEGMSVSEYDRRYPNGKDYQWLGIWKPSIHMPKEAARIFLRVTNVRVERLQDITEEGAKHEGANYRNGKNVGWEEKMRRTAVERFAEIWDSTVPPKDRDKYGWAANPWVFVIEFERVEVTE